MRAGRTRGNQNSDKAVSKPYLMFWEGAQWKVPLPFPLPWVQKISQEHTFSFTAFNRVTNQWEIRLLPTDWHSQFAVLHETGHVFDAQHMTKADRMAAARILGHPGLRWFWGTWNPLRHVRQPNMENFADWYAQVAMGQNGPQHRKLRALLWEIHYRTTPPGTRNVLNLEKA